MRSFESLLQQAVPAGFPQLVREHATVDGAYGGASPWQAEGVLAHNGEPYYFRYRFTRVTLQVGADRKPVILPSTVADAQLFYDPHDSDGYAGTLSDFEAAVLFLHCLAQLEPVPPAIAGARAPLDGWAVFGEKVALIVAPSTGGWCAPQEAVCVFCNRPVDEDHTVCFVPPLPVGDLPGLVAGQ